MSQLNPASQFGTPRFTRGIKLPPTHTQANFPSLLVNFLERDALGHVSFCYPAFAGYLESTLSSLRHKFHSPALLKKEIELACADIDEVDRQWTDWINRLSHREGTAA